MKLQRMKLVGEVKLGGQPPKNSPQKYWEYYITPEGQVLRCRSDKPLEIKVINIVPISNNPYKGKLYGGYLAVPSNKLSEKYVHRMVAKAFVPNDDPIGKPHVDHIDGNKHNNHYTNLQWVSRSTNLKRMHAQRRAAGKVWHGRGGGE